MPDTKEETQTIITAIFEGDKQEREKAIRTIEDTDGLIHPPGVAYPTLAEACYFFGEQLLPHDNFSETSTLASLREDVNTEDSHRVVGIISGLQMPERDAYGSARPIGISIAYMAAVEKNIPVVVCTSGMTGLESEWGVQLLQRMGVPVVGNKDWRRAIKKLRDLVRDR